ncbi:MAG TPA: hypothetical protein VGT44_20020 [Ktedonobacteraceae bacterium]|nr:hypothetical protein [Ktedonobacteraceae bacterium]
MQVLESTDRIPNDGDMPPRSLPPLRPILQEKKAQAKSKQREKLTEEQPTAIIPVAQRASKLRARQTEDDGVNQEVKQWKALKAGETEDGEKTQHRASKKADAIAPAVTDEPTSTTTETIAPAGKKPVKLPRPKIRSARTGRAWYTHPFFYLAVGMIFMLALWAILTSVASWWSVKSDDIQFGRPRTFQIDAVVGHNDSPSNPSHFIAINLNGRIEIIEFPGGDGSKARIYIGPQLYGTGEDLVPVTLSFIDVNGNHRPDMVLHFQNTQIVFVNENGGFRPATAQELPIIQRYIQQHGG